MPNQRLCETTAAELQGFLGWLRLRGMRLATEGGDPIPDTDAAVLCERFESEVGAKASIEKQSDDYVIVLDPHDDHMIVIDPDLKVGE